MDEVMRLGVRGEALIKGFEKLRLTPYLDSGGVLTVGWGHTEQAGGYVPIRGVAITQAEAQELFDHDIASVVSQVNRLVTVDLNQNQFDALVSFEFNAGGLAKSTLLRKLNSGDYNSVPTELMKWSKCRVDGQLVSIPGLVTRRRAEVCLWCTPSPDEGSLGLLDTSANQDVEPPQAKGMLSSKIGNASVVVGGAGGLGLISTASDTLDGVDASVRSAGNLFIDFSRFAHIGLPVVFAALIVCAGLIWFWRHQNMRHEVM